MWKYHQYILIGAGLVICLEAMSLCLIRPEGLDRHLVAGMLLLVPGLAAILYPAIRSLRFHKRLRNFVRHLLAGNYDAGVKVSDGHDDIAELDGLLEKLAANLRAYDQLRADRVRTNQRLLDLVLEHVPHPILLLDVEKGAMACNPAAQTTLGTSDRKLTIPPLSNNKANKDFTSWLHNVIENEKSPQEGQFTLQLSTTSPVQTLAIRLLPIKNQSEAVTHALLFLESVQNP